MVTAERERTRVHLDLLLKVWDIMYKAKHTVVTLYGTRTKHFKNEPPRGKMNVPKGSRTGGAGTGFLVLDSPYHRMW